MTAGAAQGPIPGGDPELIGSFCETVAAMPVNDLPAIVTAAGRSLGARSARLFVADYAVSSLHELGAAQPAESSVAIDGSLPGRAYANGEVLVAGDGPVVVWAPVTQDSQRIGVVRFEFASWDEQLRPALGAIVRELTLVLLSKRRFTDAVSRSRRRRPLSVAAEIQWDLLPPLSCVTDEVAICGTLEPAYTIGGDSFDFAVNADHVEFAIVDAVGHGTPAVLKSVLAVTALRNARRERRSLEAAYLHTGELLTSEWDDSSYVTGLIGSLEIATGQLTWLNAGHPLPLLVRGGKFVGELECRPSLPMGLGGEVVEVAQAHLQSGDWVLFYTDGVTDTTSSTGEAFGQPRLVDHLVRATLDGVHPSETVRHLTASIVQHTSVGLRDDATLLLLEYRGHPGSG